MGEIAVALLAKYWQYFVIATLVLAGWHLSSRADYWHTASVECSQGRKADQDAYKAAQAEAKAVNIKTVADTEAKWKKASEDSQEDLNAKLSTARATVADYAARMRSNATATAGRAANPTGVSGTAASAVVSDGNGEDTFVPVTVADLNICAENTVKAQGWQDFWKGVVAAQPIN